MNRYRYQPDEYELERSRGLERQLDRNEAREPYWMHYRRRSRERRPRYFSRLMFRPLANAARDALEKPAA